MTTFIENLGLLTIGWIVSYLVIHRYQVNKDILEIREKVLIELGEVFADIYQIVFVVRNSNPTTEDLIQLNWKSTIKSAKFRAVLFSYIEDEDQVFDLNEEIENTLEDIIEALSLQSDTTYPFEPLDKQLKKLEDIETRFRQKIKKIIKPHRFQFPRNKNIL